MKPKILNNYTPNQSPYLLFSSDKNISSTPKPNQRSLNKPKNIYLTNSKYRPLTTLKKNSPRIISSISKSLKSVTLSSQLYGNYINFYSNITQEYTFKTPHVTKYPLLKNEKYLPITLQNFSTDKNNKTEKKKLIIDNNNTKSIFLSFMRETKNRKKVIEEKPYGFKYGNTKIRFDRAKSAFSYMAGIDFGELCENNIFETKIFKLVGIKNIDMYNSLSEKKKNFSFFKEYFKQSDELNDIFNECNFHRSIKFKWKTAIQKEIIDFNLDIYSMCLKFYMLESNNSNLEKKEKKNICQKMYFPYELLPIFYLLDFTSFKVFLSEIINYDINNNTFIYIKENKLIDKIKKYYNYIKHSLESDPNYINNITYNKTESNFPLIYDWIVSTKNNNSSDTKNNYKCYKLKICLPKIKFNISTLDIKIFKYLNKHVIANLLNNKFINWEKFIFFDLFSTKKFKLMMNYIMLNKQYKISDKKIYLNKRNVIQNKAYEFYITQTGEKPLSFYYTFVPYIILILYGEKDKDKKFQKIFLTLKESKNIIRFKKYWGVINTLFKCMFIDTMKNEIFFRLDLLDDNCNDLYKVIVKENEKNNAINNYDELNNDIKSNNNSVNNIRKVPSKIAYLNKEKEKEKDKTQTKYKDNQFEISFLNCTLQKINITSVKSELKYYNIPPNILKCIFSIKDENKIFNTNYTSIPIMGKCIGENSSLILSAKEANIITEEQSMKKKAIKKDLYDINKTQELNTQISTPHSKFDALNKIKSYQTNNNINLNLRKTSKNKLTTFENIISKVNTVKSENKYNELDENQKHIDSIMKSKDLNIKKNIGQRRVSITNIQELKKSRIEYGANDKRIDKKRRTSIHTSE